MNIIDHKQLAECLTGEIDLDVDLMRSAIAELRKRISAMRISLMNGDQEAWRADAHRSLGAAATLGFKALADEFRNAECHTHTDTEQTTSLEEIDKLIELTQQELRLRNLL